MKRYLALAMLVVLSAFAMGMTTARPINGTEYQFELVTNTNTLAAGGQRNLFLNRIGGIAGSTRIAIYAKGARSGGAGDTIQVSTGTTMAFYFGGGIDSLKVVALVSGDTLGVALMN